MNKLHEPVLLQEVLDYLQVEPKERYIDATVGMGGHALEIVKKKGYLLGIDQDSESLRLLKQMWEEEIENSDIRSWILTNGSFRNINEIAKKCNFTDISGVLFDLGVSSWQIEKSGRGISYLKDEMLDMRLDSDKEHTAKDIINKATQEQLYEIISKYSEEKHSGRFVDAIIRSRPINTTGQLNQVLEKVTGNNRRARGLNARIYQALRIAVNDELKDLNKALPGAVKLLKSGGRVVAISFHSLEDRIVKQAFKNFARNKSGRVLTKKPIVPSRKEVKKNTRARSAKMRVFEKY